MSVYRNAVFIVKGLKEFTKKGYENAAKSFNPDDLNVDVSDQAFMITGANSGIGKETALEIAKKGGTVHMVCRNQERGEAAQKEIMDSSSNQKVHLHLLDMSQPRKIREFTQNFIESGKPLNVLVNNAGCMVNEREVNEDGLEKNFATNTLGTYMITMLLLPLLEKNINPRVITVSSGGMLTQKLDTKDLQFERMKPFDGTMAYAQNKRQQVVMTQQWGATYPAIHFSCMHPGWADTEAVRTSMPSFYNSMKDRLRTAGAGADTVAWLCLSPAAIHQKSGRFFLDRKEAGTHLPLAWTKSTLQQESQLMTLLEEIASKFTQ